MAGCLSFGLLVAGCSEEATLPGEPLRIAGIALADAVAGRPYDETVTVTGGVRPYVVRLDAGRLPSGLALQNGVLLGTPEETGTFEFTLSVQDANLSSTFQEFTLRVVDVPVPRVDVRLPPTEVVDRVTIPVHVLDASNVRAVRWQMTWWEPEEDPETDPSVEARVTVVGVAAARDDVVVAWTQDRGLLRVDAVTLGPATSRDGAWFVVDVLVPEATVMGVDVTSETLFEDRHVFVTGRVGAPPFAGDVADDAFVSIDDDEEDDDEEERP